VEPRFEEYEDDASVVVAILSVVGKVKRSIEE
jgi:hypothetical protein